MVLMVNAFSANLNYKVIQLLSLYYIFLCFIWVFFHTFFLLFHPLSLSLSLPYTVSVYVCAHYQDCFSMTNISWYGGASVRGQTWPINDQNATMQPFSVSDLKDNPSGFGSALERYFLGSSGRRSLWE